MDELVAASALDQARLIRQRQVSPVELVELYLQRIERLNPVLNAYVTVVADRAMTEARAAETALTHGRTTPPFYGVPIAIKDLDDTSGIRTTYSHKRYADFVPDEDTAVVRRLKQAGFIILGKTNVPEFGVATTTESELNGLCRNPWDLARSAGGSSGGSASACAAGLCPVAQASDGAGSIRIPASLCGLVGLKPSRGRVSLGPGPGSVLEGASTQGVLTRTVADTAAILDILQGYETGDPYWTPPPSRPFIDEIGLAPGRLRIGVTTSNPSGAPVSPECVAAVEEARQLLVDVGHQTDEAAPDWNRADILDLYRRFYATLFAYDRPAEPADLEPPNRELLHYATRISSMDYARASVELQLWSRRIVQFWNSYDILLCPTLATPPPLLGTTYPGDPIPCFGMHAYIPFTPVANITGQPAINLPLHWTSGGLPIGVQLTARPAGEAELLRIAAQLEEAQPWRDRRPPVWDVESVTVTP